MPGPVPNRSTDLSRTRDSNRGDRPQLRKAELKEVVVPEPDPDWGNVAQMVWNSLQNSGQSVFFQDSDYAYAYLTCQYVDYLNKNPGARGSAMLLATVSQMMTNLMMTEAERRRARIELETPEPPAEPAHLAAVRDLRESLRG